MLSVVVLMVSVTPISFAVFIVMFVLLLAVLVIFLVLIIVNIVWNYLNTWHLYLRHQIQLRLQMDFMKDKEAV